MKSEQAILKRARASVASAKKSLVELIGERAAGLFGPIEAVMQQAENELADAVPFDKAERSKELTQHANDEWAKLMERRNPRPRLEVKPEDAPADDDPEGGNPDGTNPDPAGEPGGENDPEEKKTDETPVKTGPEQTGEPSGANDPVE